MTPTVLTDGKLRNVQSASERQKLLAFSQAVVAMGCIAAVAVFVVLAFIRVRYPYELEWLESEMLEHVRRLHDGTPLYTIPTVDLTQLPYAPLSFGLGALLSTVFGVHFWVMRAISITATLVTFALLGLLVMRETRNRFAAVLAVGLYAGSFRWSGTFFDVGKSDALFILLALAAIYFARRTEQSRSAVFAGVLMSLAILTKQTAIFFAIPLALYLLITKRTFGVLFSGVTVAFTGVVTFALHVITHGWYTFFVWQLLFEHDVAKSSRTDFFTQDLSKFVPVLLVIVLAWRYWSKRDEWWVTGFYAAAAAGLFAGAWTGRLHTGGFSNVLMPAALAVALLTGLAVAHILRHPTPIAFVAVGLCAVQLVMLGYDPGKQIPSAADRRTGDALLVKLSGIDGNIWLTRHPAYPSMVGKPTFAGQGGIEDVFRGKDDRAKQDLKNSIAEAIHHQRFDAIIFDDSGDARGFPSDWQNYYVQTDMVVTPDDGTFRPVASFTGGPRVMWVKRTGLSLPANASDDVRQ